MKPYEAILVADKTVPMDGLLALVGLPLRKRPPCQIRCPVHKLGTESTPSARVYEDNAFVWCYTCGCQYRPTEIFVAHNGCTRDSAAKILLQHYPPTQDLVESIIKEATTPKKIELDTQLEIILDNTFLSYKRKVPYEVYRDLYKRIENFKVLLREIKAKETREEALTHFLVSLKKDSKNER